MSDQGILSDGMAMYGISAMNPELDFNSNSDSVNAARI